MDKKSKFEELLTSLKHYKKYKVEIIILLISFVFVICSFIASMIADKDTIVWFARSGSIMVLLAVIVEYRLHNQTIQSISRKVIASVTHKAKIKLTNTIYLLQHIH
ncbi:MAG: hypothetical protein CL624_09510 [Arcobacter sp.]|jgi:F0F1-type ATP synthase assembly protein I|nr:hypothetical protein [Arcobacter sp.]|tara:strand:+ start:23613 stop:23930 length:318 start_codon:yes stop_codon:yes gene_type:complete